MTFEINSRKSPDKENIAMAIDDLETALAMCAGQAELKKLREKIEAAIDVLENGY
jgi:hypothetical protein